jgi:ABC-type multidrug transport system fused ATPase/permease subunit
MVGVAQGTVRDIRADLFDKLQTLTLRYFDARTHGELNGFIEETVSRQKVVKAFRLE